MNCDIVKDIIPMYIDGCCSEASSKALEEHLNTCAECKKLYEDMKSSKDAKPVLDTQKPFCKLKKIILDKKFIIVSSIVLVIVIIVGIYWYRNSNDYEYDDEWIIGKTEYQIIERYGEFDRRSDMYGGGFARGYCVKPFSYDSWFGEPIWPEYYMIYFDEQGIAYKVKIKEVSTGG